MFTLTSVLTVVVTLSVTLVVGVAFYYIGVRVRRPKLKLTPMAIHMINTADFSTPRKGWSTPIFHAQPKSEQQKQS